MKLKLILSPVLALLAFGPAVLADSPKEVKPYPLKTCVVSGEKLDSMGKPYVFTNGTQEVRLCCKDCLKDFKKDPAKYTRKIEEAGKK
jgi:YHS domain-containing protein